MDRAYIINLGDNINKGTSDRNGIRTHYHLIRRGVLNHLGQFG